MLHLLLVILLVMLIIGALPRWPHSTGWGPYPSGVLVTVLLVVLLLWVLGYRL